MHLSNRSTAVNVSGIRRVFDLAAKLKDPVNLSIGVPYFDAFPEMKLCAQQAIDDQKNGYTVTQGIEPFRAALREKYHLGVDEDVFLTSGVSGGLLLSFMAVLDIGDEILIPDPFFGMYRDLVNLIGSTPVLYDCYPDFKLEVDKIEQGITSRTRAILVNSPANPTGYSCTQEELDSVRELAKRRGLWLIYDEIYEAFCYDRPHAKIRGGYDGCVVLNGMSKSHGVPGWRIGWAIGPNSVIEEMKKVQQYSFVCQPAPLQWGANAGLNVDLGVLATQYLARRDLLVAGLKDKFNFVIPSGAFYLFAEAPGGDGDKFVDRCIEQNLLVVPGSSFSTRNTHFRISFSASIEQIGRGIEILRGLA